jgi:hypothetical protein
LAATLKSADSEGASSSGPVEVSDGARRLSKAVKAVQGCQGCPGRRGQRPSRTRRPSRTEAVEAVVDKESEAVVDKEAVKGVKAIVDREAVEGRRGQEAVVDKRSGQHKDRHGG